MKLMKPMANVMDVTGWSLLEALDAGRRIDKFLVGASRPQAEVCHLADDALSVGRFPRSR